MIEFQAVPITLDASAGEDSPRTITGVAVPWDTAATVSSGEKVAFKRGAFDVNAKAPKLLEGHDMTQLRGVVTELVEAEEGLLFTAKFANTRASDEAIELVKAGAYDSVSVGAVPVKFKYDKQGVMVVSQANLVEISLVAQPAFADAVITEIAASEPDAEPIAASPEADEPQPDNIPEEEIMSQDTPTVEASAEIVPTTPLYAQAARPFKLPTAAEYIAAQLAGGTVTQEFNARLRAAAPDVVTGDLDGILPTPIVAPVYNGLIGRRPLIDALGTKAMPQGGKVFIRPSVTTHTTIGASNGENQALDSGTFVVTDNQVTKSVFGGYVQLSEEAQDWSQPEVLSLIIDDMSREYAKQTETAVETAFTTGITAEEPLPDATNPAEWASFVWNASKTILEDSSHLPTHLFVSPAYWALLGQLVDDADRPLFPQVGPMNAFGNVAPGNLSGTAFGLSVVVLPYLTSGFVAVGNADGFEVFEQMKGAISVEASDGSLSRYIKFRGYLASLMIDSNKFVKREI
jgi:HK97 family phage prohead protease